MNFRESISGILFHNEKKIKGNGQDLTQFLVLILSNNNNSTAMKRLH